MSPSQKPASAHELREGAEAIVAETMPARNVVEALRRVMRDLPAIGKDNTASPQQGGYAYRGIEQITQHTQRLFALHGVVFVPRVVSYEVRDLTINNKPWTDVYELVEYDVYGPAGVDDRITVGPILAIGRDNSDKGGNKCLTQAYKYALLQALSISDAKDDADGTTHEADPAPREWNAAMAKQHLLNLCDGDAAQAKECWTAVAGDFWPSYNQERVERGYEVWVNQDPAEVAGEVTGLPHQEVLHGQAHDPVTSPDEHAGDDAA